MLLSFVFFNDPAPTEIYTFPYTTLFRSQRNWPAPIRLTIQHARTLSRRACCARPPGWRKRRRSPRANFAPAARQRSEEHTSELQSRQYLVCRLLLEKKKKKTKTITTNT